MLTILRVHLPVEVPVVGCLLTPLVIYRLPGESSNYFDDIPESTHINGFLFSYKWYRIHKEDDISPSSSSIMCSIHPTVPATIQCLGCEKSKVSASKSYHCSSKCFTNSWQRHRAMHHHTAASSSGTSGTSNEESQRMPHVAHQSGTETWYLVARTKRYIPSIDDIGHALKFECVVVEATTSLPVGQPASLITPSVIVPPQPTPRRLIPIGTDASAPGNFTVLSYNVLCDTRAAHESFSYCPKWALTWSYRKQNLLREILSYRADIICLQEVQCEQFDNFFRPEMRRHGYEGQYKRRTNDYLKASPRLLEGCATFFRMERFCISRRVELEFNKVVDAMATSVTPARDPRPILRRYSKDHIALILILQMKVVGDHQDDSEQLVCVTNTQLPVPPTSKDVTLWELLTLTDALEKITGITDIAILVCGDFDMLPGSAAHCYFACGQINTYHSDFSHNPDESRCPLPRCSRRLPLMSAYSTFITLRSAPDEQVRRMLPEEKEPKFTQFNKRFIGTVDYIFYTGDCLAVESLLELMDDEYLRSNNGIPSPEWSSDHIALMAEFSFIPRYFRR